MYSIRMRGSKEHRHISGAEKLVDEEEILAVSEAMIKRALHHSKGKSDTIHLHIEQVRAYELVPALEVAKTECAHVSEAIDEAKALLAHHGITPEAIERAYGDLMSHKESMGGAMIVSSLTGERLDSRGDRGVRVSRMDRNRKSAVWNAYEQQGHRGDHFDEAIVLASKVISAPGMVGELCVSDDPDYTVGYVSYGHTYHRLLPVKSLGDTMGGRIFFVKPDTDIEALIQYLEKKTVLVG